MPHCLGAPAAESSPLARVATGAACNTGTRRGLLQTGWPLSLCISEGALHWRDLDQVWVQACLPRPQVQHPQRLRGARLPAVGPRQRGVHVQRVRPVGPRQRHGALEAEGLRQQRLLQS